MPKWKVYRDRTQLSVPASTWSDRGVRYHLVEVDHVHAHTVLKTSYRRLHIRFQVANETGGNLDVHSLRPSATLTLDDGTVLQDLTRTASGGLLPPGGTGEILLMVDVREGVSPQLLVIDGQQIRW